MCILLICFTAFCYTVYNNSDNRILSGNYIELTDGWTCNVGDDEYSFDTLPENIDNKHGSTVILSRTLDEITSNKSLVFFSSHQLVNVKIDGETIYQFDIPKGTRSKTPGYGWLFVPIEPSYSNKLLTVEISSHYKNVQDKLPYFYYGDGPAIFNEFITESIPKALISFFIFLIGALSCIFYIAFGKKIHIDTTLLWLGLFSISFSVWSMMETNFLGLFFGHYLLFSQITFISLFLLMIPFILLIKSTLLLNKVRSLEIIAFTWGIFVIIAVILQLLGIADLRKWSLLCNATFTIAIFMGISIFIYRVRHYHILKKAGIIPQLFFLSLIGICVVIDCFRYIFLKMDDSALFSRVGFLIYITANGIILFKNIMIEYNEYEKYKNLEDEAFHDALTKCLNRTAYNNDYFNIYAKNPYKYSAILFDLNNLKYFNDTFGHSTGDWYIIVCSEIIQDLFGYSEEQKVYRIGGDEFCAIVSDISYDDYLVKLEELTKRTEALSNQYFDGRMGIASGYAHFDDKIDLTFNETIKRADLAMYEQKLKMKSAKKVVSIKHEEDVPVQDDETVEND